MSALASAGALVETALTGDFRRELLAEISHHADAAVALRRLRDGMRTHLWRARGQRVDLGPAIEALDTSVRRDGFHVLHDWDGKADHVNPDSIAVNVLDFVMERHPPGPPNAIVLAILLDYYFAYLLMLLSTAALAEPDADAHLDRLNGLVSRLQGSDGSGQLFAADAETLFLIGTSHFEARDSAYDAVLERARPLSFGHRRAIALGHAASLGSHLRFGFQVTYIKSYPLMRDDNGVDYRWLCFALAVLMEEYERQQEGGEGGPDRAVLVEAIANGLSADPEAFVMAAPHASLQPCLAEWTSVRDRLHKYRRDLVEAFKPCRPLDSTYSPIAFFFNFSHNVLKGTVVDALSWAEAWHVSFTDLLTGTPPGDERGAARMKLARTLMGYAQASPDMIGGRLSPVIVYDPITGRRLFADTVRWLES
jgi:hypothetical protein